jgi:AraC-like DNA-binding protein
MKNFKIQRSYLTYSFVKHIIQKLSKKDQDINLLLQNLGINSDPKNLKIDSRVFEMLLSDVNTFFANIASPFKLGLEIPIWKVDLIGTFLCRQESLGDIFKELQNFFNNIGNLKVEIDYIDHYMTFSIKNLETWKQPNTLSFFGGMICHILQEVLLVDPLFENFTSPRKLPPGNHNLKSKSFNINEEIFSIKLKKSDLALINYYYDEKIKNDIAAIIPELSHESLSNYERIIRTSEYLIKTSSLSLENLEKQIGFSRRKIQFVLAENNFTYRELKDNLRKDLCITLMIDEKKDLQYIYQKLGFATQSSFSNSFKKWFGTSPKKYISAHSDFKIE